MKFSVIIPVYNKEKHIKRAVNSVLNQTYSDFELIIINDASTDNSLAEILKFDEKRIRLFHRKKPGPGGYAARNLGIKKARGEWVAFLDADDEWFPYHLEKYFILIKKYPDIKFLSSGWKCVENNKEKFEKYYKLNKKMGNHFLSLKNYLKKKWCSGSPVCTIVACFKKCPELKGIKIFPEGKTLRGGDEYAWFIIFSKVKKMLWSNHIGAIYYQDSENMVTKMTRFSPQTCHFLAKKFNKNFTNHEYILLLKFLNKIFFSFWISDNHFNLYKNLYWKNDKINCLIYSIFASFLYLFDFLGINKKVLSVLINKIKRQLESKK
ncbi:MAG: glycosyltransferase family 2 protein [Candidatus Muiribacteriota bacterium]